MPIEKAGQRRHCFMGFGQVGVLPEEVPHTLEDVEIRFDARVPQLAMQEHRLAQAHVAGAGKQKSGNL
jgi:hypothetical protein